jgi:hypothetical protein
MKTIIAILATLLIASTPVAAQRSNLNAPISPRITITERCQQLHINCTKSEVLEVGRRVQQLYLSRYNQKPPQKQGVNIYTTTDRNLIDQAIVNQLATENEKLRKELESQNKSKVKS